LLHLSDIFPSLPVIDNYTQPQPVYSKVKKAVGKDDAAAPLLRRG